MKDHAISQRRRTRQEVRFALGKWMKTVKGMKKHYLIYIVVLF